MEHLSTIYAAAVLLPLGSFVTILLLARHLGKVASVIATGAILVSAVLSFIALTLWLSPHFPQPVHHGEEHAAEAHAGHDEGHATAEAPAHAAEEHAHAE